MTFQVFRALTLAAALVGAPHVHSAPPPAASPMFSMVQHLAVDGVAEIVAATPDGMTLVYTSADAGLIGLVDISRPERPVLLQSVDVRRSGVGEPTSVAISPDGRYAVVAVRLGDDAANAVAGVLRVYDMRNPRALRWVKDVTVGVGPDAVALAGQGRTLRAVVAIEDEETDAKGDATLDGKRPGRIEVVGLQDLYGGRSSGVQRIELVEALTATPGVLYPNDPQPEFVSIDKRTKRAVVSLQENNALAILDLSHPTRARLERVFPAGTVTRERDADILKDKEIALKDSFRGRREPDAVVWVAPGVFATANEGDGKKDPDGVLPGARGFTLMNRRGEVVFEGGGQTERRAVQHGHYPDARSAAKGVEIESVAHGVFGGKPYLLVASERGGFVEVYRIDDPARPRFVQWLPTGLSPEGLTTVTRRRDGQQLIVAANELEGSLNIYRFHREGAPARPDEPLLMSTDAGLPWGALSGLTTDGRHLYAVPDNAFAPSRIFRIDASAGPRAPWLIDRVIALTDENGKPLTVDPEGIARVTDGFWIASEGASVEGNELIRVNSAGVVQQRVKLPDAVVAKFASPKTATGFEGVAASADGQTLYVALQRGFDPAQPMAAILRLHLPTMAWTSALYPLDQHSKDAKTWWTGLSEIQLTDDGRLLLLERDKGGGEGRAVNAEIKRVYSVRADDMAEGALLAKTLVRDLRKDFNWLHEKAEGMVLHQGALWVVNDNDGAGWTRLLRVGGY